MHFLETQGCLHVQTVDVIYKYSKMTFHAKNINLASTTIVVLVSFDLASKSPHGALRMQSREALN